MMASQKDARFDGKLKIYITPGGWMSRSKQLESPKFTADALQGTKWSLWLFLIDGYYVDYGDYVGIYLLRENNCCGKETIEVNYEIAILDKNGSFLRVENRKDSFSKYDIRGFPRYVTRKEVFFTKRESFLPEETLTVQCKLWNKEGKPVNSKHFYARTIFSENRKYFIWQIDAFSTVEPGLRKKFKDNLFNFDLVLNGNLSKKLDIDFISCHDNIKYIAINTYILDSTDIKENQGNKYYFVDDLKEGGLFPVFLFTNELISKRELYLPNDVLSLEIRFIYWTIDHFGCNDESGNLANKDFDLNDGEEKSEKMAVLIDDLKSMFSDAILSDTELRTSTKSFPAHKNILSARSPVFRKMFGNDMKEKNSGHVDIIDFEDDTLHRMLLYIYTDSLEDLQFESAMKLYAAADKYEILSLRNKCSTFLKDSLCPNRACDVLILADMHHDDDLKSSVQSYILVHDEVFSSLEWKHLMDSNVKLAADIMYRKINPGSSYPCNV
ncbi:TD and POZ domain-containing protein 5 [Argiope bruennichi]|uniref:TD and POZ domain-containing protein 5 n=1 Tax=Argiope bruennichi TaxID=94029 RepID=A0A8T0F9G1_ARGBR|nr:TD and POZ domain-containing protein 5 [Argiope bruennichi]